MVSGRKSLGKKRQREISSLWSYSYFACAVSGATIETLRAYVENQSTPD
ncbi:transposase [Candidatus Enterovibrio escicola]|nr:transposase [Candidatus Enterovibrio escacola]